MTPLSLPSSARQVLAPARDKRGQAAAEPPHWMDRSSSTPPDPTQRLRSLNSEFALPPIPGEPPCCSNPPATRPRTDLARSLDHLVRDKYAPATAGQASGWEPFSSLLPRHRELQPSRRIFAAPVRVQKPPWNLPDALHELSSDEPRLWQNHPRQVHSLPVDEEQSATADRVQGPSREILERPPTGYRRTPTCFDAADSALRSCPSDPEGQLKIFPNHRLQPSPSTFPVRLACSSPEHCPPSKDSSAPLGRISGRTTPDEAPRSTSRLPHATPSTEPTQSAADNRSQRKDHGSLPAAG